MKLEIHLEFNIEPVGNTAKMHLTNQKVETFSVGKLKNEAIEQKLGEFHHKMKALLAPYHEEGEKLTHTTVHVSIKPKPHKKWTLT